MQANFEDWLGIVETKARYCRFVDAHDWESYADCFTEDYVFDTRPIGGRCIEGRDAAIASVRQMMEHASSAHHVHNPEMRFDADGADVIWAFQDRVDWGEGRSPVPGVLGHTSWGHYSERYVKGADGRWRIKRNVLSFIKHDQRRAG